MTEDPPRGIRTLVEQAGMAEAAPSDSHHAAAGRGGAEASAAAPAAAAAAPFGDDAVFAAASDPVIPEDVIRLYASIPAKVQAVINQAGIEAKERGETMEVRVSELEWLTHLTPDDVYYAALLLGRGESACVIVKDLLTRAEHLAMKGPPPTPAPVVPYVTQVRTYSPSRHPSSSPLRKPTQSVGSPTRLAARLVSPAVCTVTEPYDPSRTRPKRRSFTPKHPTRAYNMAAMEYQQIRELSKDATLPGPDAVRAGIHVRSAARTASPPPVLRSEAIARADPNTIVGKLLKSPNAGASLRSRSSRMTLPREPATQYASLFVCLVVCLFVCLVVCLFVCLVVCLVVWLFGRLFGCLQGGGVPPIHYYMLIKLQTLSLLAGRSTPARACATCLQASGPAAAALRPSAQARADAATRTCRTKCKHTCRARRSSRGRAA